MGNFSRFIIINLAVLCTTNLTNTKMNKTINENAPVVEKQHIFIPAPPERVWEVLSDINKWPEWQHEVTHAELNGALKEGTVFKWKANGIPFTSQLHTVKEFHAIGWTGKTFGAKAVHNWCIETSKDGTTVHVEESLQGLLPTLFKKKFSRDLHQGMQKNLNELLNACSI